MKYYYMCFDYNKGEIHNYIYCSKVDMHGLNEYAMVDGISLSQVWQTADCFHNSREFGTWSDFICNAMCFPIVSPKFVELTYDLLKNQAEFLDVTLTDEKDGSVTHGCKALNVLNVVDAIDFEHSDYSTIDFEGDIVYNVRKYAIFEEKVRNFDIFRLEKSRMLIFVSEKIKDIICKNKLTGFYFKEIKVN